MAPNHRSNPNEAPTDVPGSRRSGQHRGMLEGSADIMQAPMGFWTNEQASAMAQSGLGTAIVTQRALKLARGVFVSSAT